MRCLQCRLASLAPARRFSAAAQRPFDTLQPFTSGAGRRLFVDSAASASLHAYLPLAAQRSPQPEAALQGACALTVVLNAMGVDPGRVWKWPWRWYAESMLPAGGACATLAELAALARTQGVAAHVAHVAPPACTLLHGLRAAAHRTSTTPQGRQFAVVAYHRASVAGRQEGEAGAAAQAARPGAAAAPHFSLVAGFHPQEDAVLLMDVYPARSVPSWVSLAALHAAMLQLDGAHTPAHQRRGGFALIAASPPPGAVT
jgi:glutathione gamma-glutamylcysteinyltransferase